MRRKNLDHVEIERMRKLYNSRYNFDIAKRIGCSKDTVQRYVNAFNAGFKTPLEHANAIAKKAGYKSCSDRYAVSRFLKGKGTTLQEKFEDMMELRGLIRNSRAHLVESVASDLDIKMDRDDALEILATRHYSQGRIFYGRPNPNGAREVRVIIGIYYKGRTLKELGKEIGVCKERIRGINGRGLRHLYDIMTMEEFR